MVTVRSIARVLLGDLGKVWRLELSLRDIKQQNLLGFLGFSSEAKIVVHVHKADDLTVEAADLLKTLVNGAR